VVIDIKVSWIKTSSDENSFRIFKNMGFSVFELDTKEDVDLKIQELVLAKCNLIFVSDEIAGLSQDLVKTYAKNQDVNIIITNMPKE